MSEPRAPIKVVQVHEGQQGRLYVVDDQGRLWTRCTGPAGHSPWLLVDLPDDQSGDPWEPWAEAAPPAP